MIWTIFNCNTTRPTLSTNVGLNATWWNCPIHISIHNFYATFLNNINKGNLSSLNAISYDNTLYNIMQVFFWKKFIYQTNYLWKSKILESSTIFIKIHIQNLFQQYNHHMIYIMLHLTYEMPFLLINSHSLKHYLQIYHAA